MLAMLAMLSRTAFAFIGVLLSSAACNRLRPECWTSQQDRPINCDPGWWYPFDEYRR